MTIPKYWIYSVFLFTLVGINFLYLFNIDYMYIRAGIVLAYILFVPGYVLSNIILRRSVVHIAEKISYIVGLSVGYLILLGLGLNTILPHFKIPQPLSFENVIIALNFTLFVLNIAAIIIFRNERVRLAIKSTYSDTIGIVLNIFALVSSIAGAIYLNNTGNNQIAIIAIVIVAINFIYIAANKHLSDKTTALSIVLISCSLLFMQSLRSWHILGWDIHPEFKYFQLVNNFSFWIHNITSDSYNSCLSITILPTIFSRLLQINDEYIYKLVFQIVFSFLPLIAYSLYRQFANRFFSVLATLYLIAQPLFIQPLTSLIRQEFGFLFFALVLLTMLSKSLSVRQKQILFTFFGVMTIFSHYSTSYIMLGILSVTFGILLLWFICRHTIFKRIHLNFYSNVNTNFLLKNGFLLLFLIVFAYLWNSVYTNSSKNLSYVISNTIDTLQGEKDDVKSNDSSHYLSLFNNKKVSPEEEYNKYVQKLNANQKLPPVSRYENATDPKYQPEFRPKEDSTSLFNEQTTKWFEYFFSAVKMLTKIFLIPGIIYLLLKKRSEIEIDYFVILIVSNGILIVASTLPFISASYNLDRLFFQVMIVSSIAVVMGLYYFLSFVGKRVATVFLIGLVALFFSVNYHIDSLLTGGPSFVNVSNKGEDYEKFYVHDSDYNTVQWITKNRIKNARIQADTVSSLKFASYTNITDINTYIYPTTIAKDSYVYASYMNVVQNRTEGRHYGLNVVYTFPLQFLDDNKDLIYNSGSSRIYK